MKKIIPSFILFLLIFYSAKGYSQVFSNPNSALKSHETLDILKIEATPVITIIYLSIENRIEGGAFCADKNIYIIDPEGKKLFLKESSGIPVCPDHYNFKFVGEKLRFTLTFPPLKEETKWVDIIEDCSSNCFWFYGVTLDNELNTKLDVAFNLASDSKPDQNIDIFRNVLDSIDSQNLGIEGLLYINIINAAKENADEVNTRVWYKRLLSSHSPRVDHYIKYLNDKGIKY